MKRYQLHLDGKNRAKHTFRTQEEALEHKNRLIRYIKDRILEGQLGFQRYMREAKAMEVVELEIRDKMQIFSVCELTPIGQTILFQLYTRKAAEDCLKKISQNTNLVYGIMESFVYA
jgi:hypothetical protein